GPGGPHLPAGGPGGIAGRAGPPGLADGLRPFGGLARVRDVRPGGHAPGARRVPALRPGARGAVAALALAVPPQGPAVVRGPRAVTHERGTLMTQIEAARKGVVTEEMRFVAGREDLDAELVRDEVARGRMVIPANKVHLQKKLEPMAIGVASACKINANIGNSAVTSKIDDELEKLHPAVHLGAHTVMDLPNGGDTDP